MEYNPSEDDLEEYARLGIHTEYGSLSFVSDYRSRSADRTKNTVDHDMTSDDLENIEEALDYMDDEEMVVVDREMGRGDTSYTCRLIVPKEHARIPLAWSKLLEPVEDDDTPRYSLADDVGDAITLDGGEDTPDFYTLQLPDFDETQISVFPETGVTYVLGSDYTGEAKKSFLRQAMYDTKQQGGLGLHAGTKRVHIEKDDGLDTVGQLFLGLSGTGKSTLTSHGLWLDGDEGAEMLQDDVVLMQEDGYVAGTEGGGLFIKTIGLDDEEQPELYEAATSEEAILENVDVEFSHGDVDFDSDKYTANSRAIITRDDLDSASEDIDLGSLDQVFFITRNDRMPPVARLDYDQAAAAFMLGESIETSAGDPDKAGEAVRVVGTNPFIIGPEGEEGNRFRELLEENDVEPYLLNTGSVGGQDIAVDDTVTLLREIARDAVTWQFDEAVGLDIPSGVPGMDIDQFHPADNIDGYTEAVEALREDRREYLEDFDRLDDDIAGAVY